MKLSLDSNAYTALMRPFVPPGNLILKRLQSADAIIMPVVVYGELLGGFRNGSREKDNLEVLRAFLANHRVQVPGISMETAEWYASLYQKLKTTGKMIPANDIWIAAISIQSGARLLTLDRHFRHLPHLAVESPEP